MEKGFADKTCGLEPRHLLVMILPISKKTSPLRYASVEVTWRRWVVAVYQVRVQNYILSNAATVIPL